MTFIGQFFSVPNKEGLQTTIQTISQHFHRSAGTTRTEGRTTPVTFEESAWNIPLVLGLADVGWFDTVFAVLLVLLNLVMQGSFSVILLSESRLSEVFLVLLPGSRTNTRR